MDNQNTFRLDSTESATPPAVPPGAPPAEVPPAVTPSTAPPVMPSSAAPAVPPPDASPTTPVVAPASDEPHQIYPEELHTETPPGMPEPAPEATLTTATAPASTSTPTTPEPATAPVSGRPFKKYIIIGATALLLLVIAYTAYSFFFKGDSSGEITEAPPEVTLPDEIISEEFKELERVVEELKEVYKDGPVRVAEPESESESEPEPDLEPEPEPDTPPSLNVGSNKVRR